MIEGGNATILAGKGLYDRAALNHRCRLSEF